MAKRHLHFVERHPYGRAYDRLPIEGRMYFSSVLIGFLS